MISLHSHFLGVCIIKVHTWESQTRTCLIHSIYCRLSILWDTEPSNNIHKVQSTRGSNIHKVQGAHQATFLFVLGIIFMGVLDGGEVEGLCMSPFQQQHFLLNVSDTFDRFRPTVPDHLYRIRFVPMVEQGNIFLSDFVRSLILFGFYRSIRW